MASDAKQLTLKVVTPDVFDQHLVDTPTSHDVMDVPSDTFGDSNGEIEFCGGYNKWGHVLTRNVHSISNDLKQYKLSDEIKNRADVIYNKMYRRTRRGKIRYKLLFYCVYCAHLELKIDVNPIELGKMFSLTPGEVQKCDSTFSPLQTGYRPPSTNTSPIEYLPDYCRQLRLSEEAVSEIVNMSRNILMKDRTLIQENPQTVAAGLLRYYLTTHGIVCDDPQLVATVTGRSNVTIDGMFRRIAMVDNN